MSNNVTCPCPDRRADVHAVRLHGGGFMIRMHCLDCGERSTVAGDKIGPISRFARLQFDALCLPALTKGKQDKPARGGA